MGVRERTIGWVRRGWWFAVALVSAALVTNLLGGGWGTFALLGGYGLVNCASVWAYREPLGPRRPRLRVALTLAAAMLLPVGLVTALASHDGLTPRESAGVGSADEGIKNESARAGSAAPCGWFGSF